jgi:hypothetical protein
MFLGVAAGLMASHLPGFPLTPAISVGMAAAIVAMLRLPLSAVVLTTVLTSKGGLGASPLIIVGVVVAYVTTLVLTRPRAAAEPVPAAPQPTTVTGVSD